MNVIIHALLHVPPLRDYLLLGSFKGKETELVKRFAALAKKLWNPRLFKSQVSPHEFLQEVGRESARNFTLEKQGDPAEFLGWLLNTLHRHMGGTKRKNSSELPHVVQPPMARIVLGIIFSTFQGHLRQEQQQIVVRPDTDTDAKPQFDIDRGRRWTDSVVGRILTFPDVRGEDHRHAIPIFSRRPTATTPVPGCGGKEYHSTSIDLFHSREI